MRPEHYYHIARPETASDIIREGLRPNEDGEIFLLASRDTEQDVAINQLFLRHYALFEISEKGVGTVQGDDVAEASAFNSRITRQSIAPEWCKHLGDFDALAHPSEFDYQKQAKLGLSRELTDRLWSLQRRVADDELSREEVKSEQAEIYAAAGYNVEGLK